VAIAFDEKDIDIDYDYCKGCGICANECPVDAIKMVEEVETQ
jgi:pyruvate ferredoxin oxidoreductase delta subunit